jgi:hypothetical protein
MGSFIFHIIKLTRNFDEAGKYEEQEIRERLRRGVKLYNKTVDGKGTNPSGEESFSTISDYHRAGNKILGKSDDKSETIKFQKKGEQSSLSNAENFCASLQGIDLKNSITQVMTLENGEVYRGEVVKGWAEGKGQVKWPNGDIYTGDFQANKPTGSGVFHWADGTIYKGDVVDGKITGKGIYAWPNGDRLDGDFIDGKRLRNSKFTRGR